MRIARLQVEFRPSALTQFLEKVESELLNIE
jgi:hypothetical protein